MDSTLPLIEAAAIEAGVPGATLLGAELRAAGYFEAGIVEQWRLIAALLAEHLEGAVERRAVVERLAVHPDPWVRFHAPAQIAAGWADDPAAGLARLRELAVDEDFRVAEALHAFGVRPFAEREGPGVVAHLLAWTDDPSPQVRRTAIQAVRPRAFWSKRLAWAHESPGLLLPLLERLRDEDERYPANAVANCFNDISRVRPELALAVLGRWLEEGDGAQVEHVARKALRSLIKDGDPRAMALFGFGPLPITVQAELEGGPVRVPNSALVFHIDIDNDGESKMGQLVYELSTTGRNPARPRRKRYQGGDHLIAGWSTTQLRVRERIFDRKAALLLDGPGEAVFWVNGVEVARVDFEVRRDAEIAG